MNLKKVQCRWHRFPSTPLPRVGSFRRQPWAIKSTSPTGLVLPTTILPRGLRAFARITHPNETVGAAPVCPPERPRSGVSIPKIHALCVGYLTTDAPLWGDAGGHTGTAPTNLHHIFPHIPHKPNNHLHTIHPKETNRPCAIRPYPSPPNHAVCSYPTVLHIR